MDGGIAENAMWVCAERVVRGEAIGIGLAVTEIDRLWPGDQEEQRAVPA
jgi:hypothetical protein